MLPSLGNRWIWQRWRAAPFDTPPGCEALAQCHRVRPGGYSGCLAGWMGGWTLAELQSKGLNTGEARAEYYRAGQAAAQDAWLDAWVDSSRTPIEEAEQTGTLLVVPRGRLESDSSTPLSRAS